MFGTAENLRENWTRCMSVFCGWADVLFGRVTTPGRSLLQLRVLCPPRSASSGGWYGRRMCRHLSCWHAVMNRDEWVQAQTPQLAATCMLMHIDSTTVFPFQVKCEQYWGSGTMHFENITVITTSEIPLEDWTIRDFDIKNVSDKMVHLPRKTHFYDGIKIHTVHRW